MSWYKQSTRFQKPLEQLQGQLFRRLWLELGNGLTEPPVGYVLEQKDNRKWIVKDSEGRVIVFDELTPVAALRQAVRRIPMLFHATSEV